MDAPVEKPLVTVDGTPMVERVLGAVRASGVETAYAVTSPHAPETAAHVDTPRIETAGEGYVPDLDTALADDRISMPVLTVTADLPLLTGSTVDAVRSAAGGDESLAVVVPVGRKLALGVSVDTVTRFRGTLVSPAGINVVGNGTDRTLVRRDLPVAVNVNRSVDRETAEWLAAGPSRP